MKKPPSKNKVFQKEFLRKCLVGKKVRGNVRKCKKREEKGKNKEEWEKRWEKKKDEGEEREREREGVGQMAFEPLLFLFYSFTTPLPSQIFNFPSQVPFFIF